MRVAVCLNCGVFKVDPWIRCQGCGYAPDDDLSLTRHLLATSLYCLTEEDLEVLSRMVKAGQPVEFPEDILKAARVTKAEARRMGRPTCLLAFLAAFLVASMALIAYAVWQRLPR